MNKSERKAQQRANAGHRKLNHQHLMFAQKHLGLSEVPKQQVFDAVAWAMKVQSVQGPERGYLLLAKYAQQFGFIPNEPASKKAYKWGGSTPNPNDDAFLLSFEWRQLRMKVLVKYGAVCQCCGASRKDGVKIHVDHIKPRRKHPELALTEANLQVLCEVCNHGKGAWDETDWRDDSQTLPQSSRTPQRQPGDGDGQNTPVTRGPRLMKHKAAG